MRYYKKANKLEAKAADTQSSKDKKKAERAREKADYSSEFDTRVGEIRKNRSTGMAIGKVILQGAFGSRSYDYMLANDTSASAATVKNAVANWLAGPIGNMLISSVERADYIKKRQSGVIV